MSVAGSGYIRCQVGVGGSFWEIENGREEQTYVCIALKVVVEYRCITGKGEKKGV